MMKIVIAEKKTLIKSLVILLALFLLWLLFYIPSAAKLKSSQQKVLEAEEEIAKIKSMADVSGESGQLIEDFRNRLESLNSKFPAKEEGVLSKLSSFTDDLGLKLVAIKPQPKDTLLGKGRKAVMVENQVCQKVFVMIELECSYIQLVNYLQKLREELPAFFIVEQMQIRKGSSKVNSKLKIRMDLVFYLLT